MHVVRIAGWFEETADSLLGNFLDKLLVCGLKYQV